MCGICGTIDAADAKLGPGAVERMAAALRHRGPDASGVFSDGDIHLGHTRLSIIDLAGGAQPMQNAERTHCITFNGEIFNYLELRRELIAKGHRFQTRSDTEVLLRLYQEEGEECVHRLNGQWAFAIWDAPRRRLFLSRDRLGVRPLYFAETPGGFAFASEIKSLLQAPGLSATLDLEALDEIFTFWVAIPPRTAFKGIRLLPPGHSLIVEDGRVRMLPYWRPSFPSPDRYTHRNPAELAEELRALLLDATRLRLRSDVPVGAYLSGGLDSTVIAALAHGLAPGRLRTFSVEFDSAEYDESSFQRDAIDYLHTEHTGVRCSSESIANVFSDVVWHTEQPILRTAPAPLYLLARLVRESGFKVVLTGEGADELLGGYDIFKEAKVRRFCARRPSSTWRPLLLRRLYPYMNGMQRQPASYLTRFFHTQASDLSDRFFSHQPRWNTTQKLKTFFSGDVRATLSARSAIAELEHALPPDYDSWDSFNQAEYLESAYLLPGYILSSQGDRMAMAHGVEARYPFLDHRLVDFASSLPPRLKMKVLDQKHLLKQASSGLIPESIRKRPKQPYRAPVGSGFLNGSSPASLDLLSAGRLARDGVFDPKRVDALVAKARAGRLSTETENMALVGILSTTILIDRFSRTGQTA
jgi:asparagine synthase (glutamine-hydrolysing)